MLNRIIDVGCQTWTTQCPGYDIKLDGEILVLDFGEYRVFFHCNFSQDHSDPKSLDLLRSHLWVELK